MTRPGSQPSIITCPLAGPGPSTTPSVHLYSGHCTHPAYSTPPSLTRGRECLRHWPGYAGAGACSVSELQVCRIEASTASIREHEASSSGGRVRAVEDNEATSEAAAGAHCSSTAELGQPRPAAGIGHGAADAVMLQF